MKKRTHTLVCLLALAPLLGCASSSSTPAPASPAAAGPDPATTEKIRAALAGEHRSDKNRARDVYRHPLETLSFFGLRDDMTVVELWPGTGWYTEVLAPVLRERGQLVVTSFSLDGPPESYNTRRAREMQELLEKNRELFGDVKVAVVAPPDQIELGPEGSADMVLTFRNLHNWMSANPPYAEKVMAAAFRVLKPGGVLGVVEHRARPGMELKSGYVEEAAAIRLAEAAGFRLAEKSEVNANPKDTKDHPHGVWSLPPGLRGGDQDRDKYLAIGESDRMTLKFVKP